MPDLPLQHGAARNAAATKPLLWRIVAAVLVTLLVGRLLMKDDIRQERPEERQLREREKPEVELTYDKLISTGFIQQHYALPWYKHVVAAYPAAQRWLEAGCGECGLLNKLLSEGKDAYGVEVSEVAIQRGCGDLPSEGRVKQSSLESIPFPDHHFDLVFSSEVLEHIPESALPKVVRELCRVSTGKLFLSISLRRSVHDPPAPATPTVHVTVKPRSWWDEQFRLHAGCVPDRGLLQQEFKQLGNQSYIVAHQFGAEPWLFPYRCPAECRPEEL